MDGCTPTLYPPTPPTSWKISTCLALKLQAFCECGPSEYPKVLSFLANIEMKNIAKKMLSFFPLQ